MKRQSKTRRQKRRNSGSSGRRPTASLTPSSRSRSANAFDNSPRSSRESSLAGDDSDTSSIASTSSRLSIVSTPEIALHHRHLLQQRYKSKSSVGGGERLASVIGTGGALSRNLSSSSLTGANNIRPRGSLSRTSSSSSISSMVSVSTSLLRWCSVCEAEFTRLRRPHRCRRCLEAVCAPCSPARLPVPGSGSPELKRACKLCAGDNNDPEIDIVASPPRAAVAGGRSPASAPPGRRGAQRRSASMGSIARAPFGVLSKAASAVAAGFYPAATAPAAAAADAAAAAEGTEGPGREVGAGGEGIGGPSVDDDDDGDVFYLPQGVPTGGDSLNAGPPSAGGDGAEGSEADSFGTPPDSVDLAEVNGKAAAASGAESGAALEKEVDTGGVLSPAPDAGARSTDGDTAAIALSPGKCAEELLNFVGR